MPEPPIIARSGGGGNDVVVAVLMLTAGDVDEARTMLTSRCASLSHKSTWRTKKTPSTVVESIGFPVCTSSMMRRMQGGGVMGLRSLSPKPHIRARCGCCSTLSVNLYLSLQPLRESSTGRGAGGAWRACAICCIMCGGAAP